MRDSGKRGLRAFVDWVENGPDWDDEAGVHEGGAGGHGGENGVHGAADTVHGAADTVCFGAGCKEKYKTDYGQAVLRKFTEEHALRVFGRVYRAVAQIVCLAGMAVLLMMVNPSACLRLRGQSGPIMRWWAVIWKTGCPRPGP